MWDACIPFYSERTQRLKALSERTGRTSAYYIREAIEKHIEEMEDLYLAEEATRRRIANNERTYTLEEVMRNLDLEN
ncbi:MAG: DNA-binding protein [Rhizobium sp.]|nr:MAG: DNA-binding protein [Rhizobium sp.]